MNREELFEVMEDIDAKHVKAAREPLPKKPVWKRRWARAVAAVLAVVILGGILLRPGESPLVTSAYAIAESQYPEMAPYPDERQFENYEEFETAYDAWWEDITAQSRPGGYADGLEGFFAASIQQFLSDAGDENRVYSPLNVYMALAMLAELTDGNSRQQILDLLGSGSVESLRAQASDLWNANYRSDGATTSVLASSVWLNEDISFVQETIDTLAENYYASAYQGKMGSDGFTKALQAWLSEQTGGLLEEQARQLELGAGTVLALATTVYFKAKWGWEFSPEDTAQGVFHAANGDVTADFMNQDRLFTDYYWGDRFGAVEKTLDNAGSMWFILPDEGVGADELLNDAQVMEFILAGHGWEQKEKMMVNLSVPKFDVVSQRDLKSGLQELGVTDVFDGAASDFTPLTTDAEGICVQKVQHDARVVIDEEGCTATAYTSMPLLGGGPPSGDEIDFVLDRPFVFVLTGLDGLPLFVGVVNNP